MASDSGYERINCERSESLHVILGAVKEEAKRYRSGEEEKLAVSYVDWWDESRESQ